MTEKIPICSILTLASPQYLACAEALPTASKQGSSLKVHYLSKEDDMDETMRGPG